MPPKKPAAGPAAAKGTSKKSASGPTRGYLFLYNLLSFGLWATCTVRTALLLLEQQQQQQADNANNNDSNSISSIFPQIFPLLLLTQSLAGLEILHSLTGLVRAPLMTTAMQVSSRFIVVWGVMYLFRDGAAEDGLLSVFLGPELAQPIVHAGDGLVGVVGKTQYCDFAFLGCMFAWGITECIRYGFFAMQLAGVSVPGWWQWLRYFPF